MSANQGKTFVYSYSDPLLESVPDLSIRDGATWDGAIWDEAIWDGTIDRSYHDRGDRQQLEQLLQDCQHEPVAYVLVRHLEELGDSVQEVSDRLAAFEALNIQLIATQETIVAEGRGIQRSDLLQTLQVLQDKQRSRRLRQGHARNRIKALPPPGKAPYGYRRGKDRYAIDRSTAPVVKDFVEHFLLYGSLRGSVRHLQKKYNKRISASTGKRWLTSPVYRGDLLYQTGDVIQNTHVPIISREEAAQIDRLLRRNSRMPARTASAPRSLSGLVSCATCQSPMKISRATAPRNDKEYLYLCPTRCPHQPHCRSIPYAEALERTIQQICQDLPSAVGNAPLPDVDAFKQGLDAQVAAKQAILGQIPELVDSGVLDPATAELRVYKIRTEMATLQNQVAQLPPVNLKTIAQVVSIPQFWLDLSEAERRFYFREFIRQIQVWREGKEWQIKLVFIF
ncbi:MAG: recombinase family protein [Elainellaceae cyanobacterium]